MAYTTEKLITNAWYLSGVVNRQLKNVGYDKLTDGLQMLNDVLAIKTANSKLIPYYSLYEFDTEVGESTYFIPKLIEGESLTFRLAQDVRMPTIPLSRKEWFGSARVEGVQSLPYTIHYERTLGGSTLYVYFVPDTIYPMQISGKFSLNDVALHEDLDEVLDGYYREYLRYALAERMCEEYQIQMPPQSYQKLKQYEAMIRFISPPDLTVQKVSSLAGAQTWNWAYINLSPAWAPGGWGFRS